MSVKQLLCVLIISLFCFSCNSNTSSDPTEQELRIEFLANNTQEISINPDDKDFSDLQDLGNAIGNASIVTLGEATHGEGNVFEAKARIAEYLITELGFSIFALETPLFDAQKAMFNIETGGDIRTNLEEAILSIWSNSAEFQPAMDLLVDLIGQGTVSFAGFDSTFLTLSSTALISDLKAILQQKGFMTTGADWDLFESLLQDLIDDQWEDNSMTDQDKNTFDNVLGEVATALNSNAPSRDDLFWQQMINSIEGEAERRWIQKNGGPSNGTGGLRDLQMGENLLWLKQEFYPNEKIIVWAASVHTAKDMSGVTAPEDPDFSFEDFETMGKVVHQALGDDLYVVAFTGLNGQWARWFDANSQSVTPSSEGSIEFLLGETDRNNTFFDLRNPGTEGAWLENRLLAKPLGYTELEANWNDVTDGFFFVRNISRSNQAN